MHLHPKLCKWVNSCIPLKFSIKRIRFQLHSLLIFCFMAPNLWFKTPINAIQGLTTCPVRNGLHIGRADILSKKITAENIFHHFCDNICNSADFIWRIYDDLEQQQEVNLSAAIIFQGEMIFSQIRDLAEGATSDILNI